MLMLSVQLFVGPTSMSPALQQADGAFAYGKSLPTSILSRALNDDESWSWAAWPLMLQAQPAGLPELRF